MDKHMSLNFPFPGSLTHITIIVTDIKPIWPLLRKLRDDTLFNAGPFNQIDWPVWRRFAQWSSCLFWCLTIEPFAIAYTGTGMIDSLIDLFSNKSHILAGGIGADCATSKQTLNNQLPTSVNRASLNPRK